jgi:hypothetical protein
MYAHVIEGFFGGFNIWEGFLGFYSASCFGKKATFRKCLSVTSSGSRDNPTKDVLLDYHETLKMGHTSSLETSLSSPKKWCRIKTQKLYTRQVCSFSWSYGQKRPRMFQKWMLRTTLRPHVSEVIEIWINVHNNDHHALNFPPRIVRPCNTHSVVLKIIQRIGRKTKNDILLGRYSRRRQNNIKME